MMSMEVLQRIAAHYFYRHLPEEIFIELEELLLPHYIDEEKEPSDDEMVELAIKFLNDQFYK